MEEDPLALDTRRRIYEAVRSAPGSGAREVQRSASTAWGETVYHLDRLTHAGLVQRERSAHQDHYFVAAVPLGDRNLLRLSRSASARRILIALMDDTGLTVPQLIERTGLSAPRVSVYLHRLMDTGVLQIGRRDRWRIFSLVDRERVAKILVAYRQGFADEWIERLVETWSEMFRP
jgi:predicted transcriptional regulator